MTTSVATPTAEFEALKSRLKATWMAGNYDFFSRFMEPSAAEFLDRLTCPPAQRCWTSRVGPDSWGS